MLVNSVINHANYLQLQKHIKYSTSHSYYVVTILHICIYNFIYKNKKYQVNHCYFDQKIRKTLTRIQ